MRIQSLIIDKKHITYTHTVNVGQDDETETSDTCKQAPLPELTNAFGALNPVVCTIMGWPMSYQEGMSVYKIQLSHTKHGTRSACFKLEKIIELTGGEPHKMTTPFVRIDEPADGESGKRELKDSHVHLIEQALFEVSRYISGERSQMTLDFKETKGGLNAMADLGRDENQNVMPFAEEPPARGRKAK